MHLLTQTCLFGMSVHIGNQSNVFQGYNTNLYFSLQGTNTLVQTWQQYWSLSLNSGASVLSLFLRKDRPMLLEDYLQLMYSDGSHMVKM